MDAKITDSKKTTNGKYRKTKKWERHQSLSAALTTVVLVGASMDHNIFGS